MRATCESGLQMRYMTLGKQAWYGKLRSQKKLPSQGVLRKKGFDSESHRCALIRVISAFASIIYTSARFTRERRGILNWEGILAHGSGNSLRLPPGIKKSNDQTVVCCRFPLFKAQLIVILFLEDLFPFQSKKTASWKCLPFTAAGQQWIFTILPSC